MKIDDLLNEIDAYNDGDEDIYNTALHELVEDDGDFTIRQFLENLLKECTEI